MLWAFDAPCPYTYDTIVFVAFFILAGSRYLYLGSVFVFILCQYFDIYKK